MSDADIFGMTSGMVEEQPLDELDSQKLSRKEEVDRLAQITAGVLESTGLVEIVKIQAAETGDIHLMGRVRKAQEKRFVDQVVDAILHACGENEIDQHICKHFFLKNEKKKFAWLVSFSDPDTKKAVQLICDAVRVTVAHKEVMEMPLRGPGTPQSGGRGTGRKGASPVGA
jgi:hypothetical protein